MPLVEVIDETPLAAEEQETPFFPLKEEQRILAHLVTHYAQPIHIPAAATAATATATDRPFGYAKDDDDKNGKQQQLSPVVKYCLDQLTINTEQGDHNYNNNNNQQAQTQIALRLLALYPPQIRPALFDCEDGTGENAALARKGATTFGATTTRPAFGPIKSTGVAVLYQYDMLLSQFLVSWRWRGSHNKNHHDNGAATSKELSTLPSSSSLSSWMRRMLTKALRDMARDVWHVLGLLSRMTIDEDDEQDNNDKQQQQQQQQLNQAAANRTLLHRWVLPSLLRCMDKILTVFLTDMSNNNNKTTASASSTESRIIRQCVVLFLGMGLLGRDDDDDDDNDDCVRKYFFCHPLRQALSQFTIPFSPSILPMPPSELSSLSIVDNSSFEKEKGSTTATTLPLKGMDWNAIHLVENESSSDKTKSENHYTSRVAVEFWRNAASTATATMATRDGRDGESAINSNKEDSLRATQRSTVRQLFQMPEMATTVRQFFFGKEDWAMDDEDEGDENYNQQALANRTRLHLGVTVVDEPVEYEKPYREIPCRMQAACIFMHLLETDDMTSSSTSLTILQKLVPILYELLSATQERIQGIGAACLYHLLNITSVGRNSSNRRNCGPWPMVILKNLATALDLSIKTCRKGPILAVLGMAQSALLEKMETTPPTQSAAKGRLLPKDSMVQAQQLRRKATQQWLMILHKNIHKRDLVWGCLIGGVVPLLKAHAGGSSNDKNNIVPPNDAVELGRLGLSCLLPLIRQDDTSLIVGDGGSSSSTHDDEIQLLALVALQFLLVAAYPVIVHHEGKLLGSLLVCLGRQDRSIRNQHDDMESSSAANRTTVSLAKQVAAMVVVSCSHYRLQQQQHQQTQNSTQQQAQEHDLSTNDESGPRQNGSSSRSSSNNIIIGSSKLQQIIDSGGVYEEHLVERAHEILRKAQSLWDKLATTAAATKGSTTTTTAVGILADE